MTRNASEVGGLLVLFWGYVGATKFIQDKLFQAGITSFLRWRRLSNLKFGRVHAILAKSMRLFYGRDTAEMKRHFTD